MLKKILFVILLLPFTPAHAQTSPLANLTGRWRTHLKYYDRDMIFYDGGKGAFMTPDGVACIYIEYTVEEKDGTCTLTFTDEMNRGKKAHYRKFIIGFLNDSTIACKPNGRIPAKIDTNSKDLIVYRKVRTPKPGTGLRTLNYHDLLGEWTQTFNEEVRDRALTFTDESHITIMYKGRIEQAKYKIGYENQPIPLDIYHVDGSVEQAFIRMNNYDRISIEWFYKNERGDRMDLFGRTMTLVKAAPATTN